MSCDPVSPRGKARYKVSLKDPSKPSCERALRVRPAELEIPGTPLLSTPLLSVSTPVCTPLCSPLYVPSGSPLFPIPKSFEIPWNPPVDVIDTPISLVFEFELPGITEDDVDIELRDGCIAVCGVKETDYDPSEYHIREIPVGGFGRMFTVPPDTCKSDIAFTCDNGILTITVRKRFPYISPTRERSQSSIDAKGDEDAADSTSTNGGKSA